MYQNGQIQSTMDGSLSQMPDLMEPFADFMTGLGDVDMMAMGMDPAMTDPSQMYAAASDPRTTQMTDSYANLPTTTADLGQVRAGPPPVGFISTPLSEPQSRSGGGTSSGSTLEFTKRRNWSQRLIEELRDFLHILSPEGRIIYVSPSCQPITGYPPTALIGKYIGEFIHPDDAGIFVREFNESIASGHNLRFFFRFRKADGSYAIFESHGHPHHASDAAAFGPNNGSAFCRGIFMMSRPYPTKNAVLLDSFLEHKIENERLKKKILDLKREELEEVEAQERDWELESHPHSSDAYRADTRAESDVVSNPGTSTRMPPPPRPAVSDNALTRQNLDEALASARADAINDKMARYEAASYLESIEMMTGLRYRDGERSQGISTGDTSPALIRGDAGIAIPADSILRDRGGGDKKKKMKIVDEYVCQDCGTLDSPEWRKGPGGPKTLCNACGLRWAKKEKKRQSISGGSENRPPTALHMH
ncbi:hypothetical protein P152DRAFT_251361 [Eremomyces bilateralis CBS 781.70]|uniref:White collar-2 n=1 Tax=Eremomyces bilateralis CBS 781.70 TaxID=1392243 RepID=A0A6G1FR72_9PEZI|nr:uncharacterized protein P152DRAFT_251361 [Eremomyces bilateralis CBS 781.70]KAF1808189.1 hypothetical protein P152DRAFT_251361 [Eremomyces bilateralis CBS 781.70]